MELPRREKNDVYLPDGTMQRVIDELGSERSAHELRIGIAYAFDYRTRMLPYWYADKRMAPCSVRTLGDLLAASGFKHLRIVLQQWTPNFQPSLAQLDGKPLDILLVSAMQVHAEPAYDLIREAHALGEARPLILAGGPKAIYEPTDFFELGPEANVGADCVMTGEGFTLIHFLQTLLSHRREDEPVRKTFARVSTNNALHEVPGLVYLTPAPASAKPVAISTGVQRLLRDLDEMPMPDAGYRMLEKPHRGKTLMDKPLAARKVKRHASIGSILSTQGCKFNCSYCPIPAVNQRTWRHKSPERLAAEIKHIHENYGINDFFGTDDNFFNNRETVVSLMTALAKTRTGKRSLGSAIGFYTEATQFDVYKNRDILPLCREGGMRGLWFGIEDITAELVNKGQDAGRASDLFKILWKLGIQPMAMMIHNDAQPRRSPRGTLNGLINQARYLFKAGAVSYQCTYLGPAVGTRDFEPAAESRTIYRTVDGKPIPQAYQDGNHVVASNHPRPWERQMNVLRAYACFYNPVNTFKALIGLRGDTVSAKRLLFQIIGQVGLVMSLPKLFGWARQLKRGPIVMWDGLQPAEIPMIDATKGTEISWAIQRPTVPLEADSADAEPMKPLPLTKVAKGSVVSLPLMPVNDLAV